MVAIVAIALMAGVSLASLWRRTAPAGGPASFSADRAMAHVEALAARPRPAGSAAHRVAREYIVTVLRETAGLDAEIRSSTATSTRYGIPYDAARVHNVVATIPGTDASRRIVLTAHYDTVLTSPGASDDAAGVATLLEAGRALSIQYSGAPYVTLLFTDAEEIGAVGAEAFLASDGLDPKRTTVLNFDARGTRGPCALIETAGDDGRLVRAAVRSRAPIAMSSLFPTLARLHGVGTDFRPFREAGASGLNLVIADGVARYHTPADAPLALDPESVRREGEAAVALVRALGDGRDDRSGAVSYFTAPWAGVVVYPRSVDLISAALVTVLVACGVVGSIRRGQSSWAGLGASGIFAFAAVTLAGIACHAAWWLVRTLGAGPPPGLADPYDPVPYRFAIVLLAVATALGVTRAARQLGVTKPTCLVPVIGVVVLWGLALRLPGAAYLLAVPMPFVALHSLGLSGRGTPIVRALIAACASFPAVIIWAPVPYFVLAGLRLSTAWAAGAIVAFAALLCASVFESARFGVDGRVAAGLLALSAMATVVGALHAGASPERPRPVSVAYAVDADTGRAFWISDRVFGGGPEDKIFADALPIRALPRFLGEDSALLRAAAAAIVVLPEPEVALVADADKDQRRELTVHVRSRRGAPWLHVFVETGKVIDATVDGRAFRKIVPSADLAKEPMWGFRYIGVDDDGFELKLDVDPDVRPVRITVVDQTSGVEGPVGGRLGPNVMYARSWVAGTTLVRRSYTF
jgi:hypothetical protein